MLESIDRVFARHRHRVHHEKGASLETAGTAQDPSHLRLPRYASMPAPPTTSSESVFCLVPVASAE